MKTRHDIGGRRSRIDGETGWVPDAVQVLDKTRCWLQRRSAPLAGLIRMKRPPVDVCCDGDDSVGPTGR